MSSSFSKLGDDLMKVPKLEVGGANWVIYKDQFLWSIDARGLVEHMDGLESEPECPVQPADKLPLTKDEEKEMKEWKKELKHWKQGEAIIKQQIAATIPDSLFMKIRGKTTALKIWDALTKEFQNKSKMVSVDLRRRLQQERCADKGDVRSHFDKLRTMRKDLASMGSPPGEDELYAIILGSLPLSYKPYISALNATSSVLGTVLSTDELMQTITDEYERRNIGKGSKKEENLAFSANESRGKKGKSKRKLGNCNNCGKPGHWARDCWEEGGGKAGQGPQKKGKGKEKEKESDGKSESGKEKKGKEAAASAKAKEEEDSAWFAMTTLTKFEDDQNSPVPTSTKCPSLNDLLEIPTRFPDAPKKVETEAGEEEEEIVVDTGVEPRTTTFAAAALTGQGQGSSAVDTDLFDSGASRHMSGQCHCFINFVKIEPRPITAADSRKFNVIGKGSLYLELPNGKKTSKILLKEVLYAPCMGVTLVSISQVTDAKSSVLFHGDICRIFNPLRTILGEISKRNGLYRIFTPRPQTSGYAGKAVEVLSIDELHRRLGHVGHGAVRQLMKKGLVKGLGLDENSKPSFCESCEWGKGH